MEISSSKFKALAITFGFSFWFFIISTSTGFFSFELFGLFVIITTIITQILSKKVSSALDIFAKINTKFFLGILFILVISTYGILFKFLRIDLLRLKKQSNSYWLSAEHYDGDGVLKQY